MTIDDVEGTGTPTDPWQLTTPPGSSAFEAYRDPDADPPALVVQVGKTQLRYHLSCIEDLHAMLTERGDWMALGSADEQKPRPRGRSRRGDGPHGNPVGGWYGFKKGLRGRFGNYVPPGPRSARAGRGRAQRAQQPDAGDLTMSCVVVRYRTKPDPAAPSGRRGESRRTALRRNIPAPPAASPPPRRAGGMLSSSAGSATCSTASP